MSTIAEIVRAEAEGRICARSAGQLRRDAKLHERRVEEYASRLRHPMKNERRTIRELIALEAYHADQLELTIDRLATIEEAVRCTSAW